MGLRGGGVCEGVANPEAELAVQTAIILEGIFQEFTLNDGLYSFAL